ncbi:hypothetical protein FBU59_000684 [Linderina macrospora]|uniref:Uncharacterized protein n=1 Tax=Linderina macrospora TaxID=4868 RepID=A0ACC1JG71_9FUNG|nr:hypothetical protein FBU59_000684 [Linderina macrospora]
MPVNENSDLQFYHNMWVGEYLRPVCDFKEEHCSIVCNHHSTWDTLDRKTRCFARELKAYYKDTEFFIKLDDDAFVDYQYVMGLMEKYRGYDKPVYISDFILNIDWSSQVLNNTWYGNGKFYMFNRKLVDCMNPEILYDGHRNEDAVFGSMVHDGCGKVEQVREDDSKIWHREYRNKNKYIDLTAIKNYRKE